MHSWSEYSTEDEDGDGNDVGCGRQEGGDDETWYMGSTPCFRANVAYTLYGVKAGAEVGNNPCDSSNYINSFFTTKGIEAFGDSVGLNYDQYGASSVCSVSYNGAYYGYDDNQNNQNGYSHGQLMSENYSSSTLGCDASGQFTLATFKGATCDGSHFLGNTVDKYNYMNRALGNLGCVQVYAAADEQDENENAEEGEEQRQEEGEEEDQSMASYLLKRSASCSHNEYPDTCPDPFNVKRARDQKLHKVAQSKYRAVPAIMPIMTSLLALGAIVLYCLANGIRDAATRRSQIKATEAYDQSIYETFSQSFHRATTDLTTRTRTFTEKLAAYAEEEDEVTIDPADTGAYEAPEEEAEDKAEDKQQTEVADAMLSEKGVTPAPKSSDKKKYKRPRMARVSKWLRGKFGKKNKTSN